MFKAFLDKTESNQLVEGIKLTPNHEYDGEKLANKLMVNDGSYYLDPMAEIAANYAEDSFLPKENWRLLSLTESKILISNKSQHNIGNSISVIKIPHIMLEGLKKTLVVDYSVLTDKKQVSCKISQKDIYGEKVDAVIRYIEAHTNTSYESIQSLGIQASVPGLITTTKDLTQYLPQTPYVGIHLDSWEKQPLKRRHSSRNRLCINIGEETRYFLFINLSILQIFHMLELKDPEDIPQYYRGTALPNLFLKKYPNYPICKLSLEPNEAYIAPTENMLHDATSVGKTVPDVSLTFLGKFSL
jgi:hypothetical protein